MAIQNSMSKGDTPNTTPGAQIGQALRNPMTALGIPPLIALAFLSFGQVGMVAAAMALPVLYASLQLGDRLFTGPRRGGEGRAIRAMNRALQQARSNNTATGALMVQIDGLTGEQGDSVPPSTLEYLCYEELRCVLCATDRIERVGHGRFAVILSGARQADLDAMIQIGRRIQSAVSKIELTQSQTAQISASIGMCLTNRLFRPDGQRIIDGATEALNDALAHGPAAMRSHSDASRRHTSAPSAMARELDSAIREGHLQAYFQPQIYAATGDISGFEALIRWQHPERGLIPPAEFLPSIAEAGLMEHVTHLMIEQSLQALAHWRNCGIDIPRVGVNFSTSELSSTSLVEWLGFELDRFDISADRLAIEVLETVVADGSDDTIISNLSEMARMGCCIDLDDFGTGHASITNINRFSVERIKIDRSFVTGIDKNPEQQNMVAAILTMADKLGLQTLAEGVETAAERDALTRLRCGQLQGFGIGRPMPLAEADRWIAAYQTRILRTSASHRHVG